MTRRLLKFPRRRLVTAAANPEHAFAARFALSIYHSEAVFTFIPKNACSTMRFSIAVDNGFLRPDDDVAWIHLNNPTFIATQRELVVAKFAFVILRCPFERLASAFLNKIVGMYPDAWVFRPEGGPDGLPEDATFTDFALWACRAENIRKNIHWRPQVDFLVYERYDSYFDFRDIPAMTARLQQDIGFNAIDARDLTRHGVSNLRRAEGNYATAPAIDLLKMRHAGEAPSPQSLYDERTIAAVRRAFADDIALYEAETGARVLF